MDLPYDIISIIIGLSDRKDIISLLSTNKYYVLYPHFFNTENYDNISHLSEFRKFYPNNLSVTDIKNVHLFCKLSVIEMSPKTFLKLGTPLVIKHLVLLPMKTRSPKEIIINNDHKIQTLELRSFIGKNITINCKLIKNLKVYRCKESTVHIVDTENYLKTLDTQKCILIMITGIENNPNLTIYNFYYEEHIYQKLFKCTLFHKFYLSTGLMRIILNQTRFDRSVTHCFNWLSDDDINLLNKHSILFKLSNSHNECLNIEGIHNIRCIENIKNEFIKINLYECCDSIIIKNSSIGNLTIKASNKNKSITIQNCKINVFNHTIFYRMQLSIINTEINKVKNLLHDTGRRNTIKLVLSNSVLNLLDYKSYDNSNIIPFNTKINEIFLNIGNGMTGGRILLGNDVECYRVITRPSSNKTYLTTYNVKLLKLFLNVPIEIYGLPDLIYIDKNSIATAFIISDIYTIDINNSENYTKLDNSYVFNVYVKKL